MDRTEWDYLYQERLAIMVESGMMESQAKESAWNDTQKNWGSRPAPTKGA